MRIRTKQIIPLRWTIEWMCQVIVAALFIASMTVAASSCLNSTGNLVNCEFIVGEMEIDPELIPATGQLEAELNVFVYGLGEGECAKPRPNVMVEIMSSRNQGVVVDIIEQPTSNTDSDGRATAFLGSSECGEAQITVKQNGATLCERWEDGQCTPLQATVVFTIVCNSNETDCDCECVDLQTSTRHCGKCGNECESGESCVDGVCQ